MLELLFVLLLSPAAPGCNVESAVREELLAQDWQTFDQSPKGFRSLVMTGRYCPALAGELISEYLARHAELTPQQRYVSEFHAGQQFAGANNVKRALPHFYRGFNPSEDAASSNRWNAYVRATIAFLEQDRITLEASVKVLEEHEENRMNASNLRLARSFVTNFGKTYDEAVMAAFR